MSAKISTKRQILFDAPSEALGPWTRVILARLGYPLLLPEDFEWVRRDDPNLQPELLLIDERRFDESAYLEHASGATPSVILLTGKHGVRSADERVVAGIKRPAGLHDLYCLMQQIFEDTPRSTPRVQTQLQARCARRDQLWESRVLSISENGCLMRSAESVPLGQRIQIDLDLPGTGPVSLEAEAAYQLLPDIGLVFSSLAPEQRTALEQFVTHTILSA